MTIECRPTVKSGMTRQRTVTFQIQRAVVEQVLIKWLRRTYPEFRGFTDDAYEFDYVNETQSTRDVAAVTVSAYKETNT